MFSISEPSWFILFLAFPFLIWARYMWRKRGGRIVFPFRIWRGDGFRQPVIWLQVLTVVIGVFFWSGAAFLIVALAGPEITEHEEIHLSRGIDIMIVLDQSPSMGARDFPPENRFDTARGMIRRFIAGRSGDSIGLVTFGSDAVLRCPPTADYDWLSQRLDALELRELGDATAIGMGLAVATLHLADSTAQEKIILLLTDGDDNAGEIRPETAADLAIEQGIRIYSVGIGGEGEVSIELIDPDTGDITRGTIMTRFDEEGLQAIADRSGGGYWRAGSPGALETVFQAVDSLETVERRVSVRVSSRGIHRPFILLGGILIFAAYLIRRLLLGGVP